MKYHHHENEYEILDEWLEEAKMESFVPTSNSYNAKHRKKWVGPS